MAGLGVAVRVAALGRLAQQLGMRGDRGGSPAWTAAHVDPVLAETGVA